jgi:hypothetical protein
MVNVIYARRSSAASTRFAVARPGEAHRTVATRTAPTRTAPAGTGHGDALLYGVVQFEGSHRDARSVVLAFENANAADEYAVSCGFDDYLVVPLSFLTPTAAPAGAR